MTNKQMPEALIFAGERPDSSSEDLTYWAWEAEQLIRDQHTEMQRLRAEVEGLRKDAEMLQFMSDAYLCVDFRYGEPACEVIVFEMPKGSSYCGDLKTDLARIMQSTKEQP